jgi:hypothetical protein
MLQKSEAESRQSIMSSYRRPVMMINDDESRTSSHHSHHSSSTRSRQLLHRHHVEIATLSLPAAASASGVQTGDGTEFVLQASAHVIGQLVDSEQQTQQQIQRQIDQSGGGVHAHQNQNPHPPTINAPCVEGVVDLEMVSQLVSGVTEKEFVHLLHQDASRGLTHHDVVGEHENSTVASRTRMSSIGDVDLELMIAEDGGEHQSLLQQSLNENGATTACLSLSADPFVHTLGEIHHQEQMTKDKSVVEDGDEVTFVETIEASDAVDTDFRNSYYPEGIEKEDDGQVTVSREAFLLSIPATETATADASGMAGSYYSGGGTDGTQRGTENIFLLALPEMIVQKDEEDSKGGHNLESGNLLRTSATNVAHTMAEFAREDIYPLFEHAFQPLPTDIRHIELRVSTAIPTDSTGLEDLRDEEVHLDVVVDRKVPLIGYVILVSGLVSLSSVGAAFDLQQGGVTPEMKAFWRFSSTAILLLFLSAKSLNREEFGKFTWNELWVWMPFAGAMYGFMCTAFVIALEMTSLVNAFSKCLPIGVVSSLFLFLISSQTLFFLFDIQFYQTWPPSSSSDLSFCLAGQCCFTRGWVPSLALPALLFVQLLDNLRETV